MINLLIFLIAYLAITFVAVTLADYSVSGKKRQLTKFEHELLRGFYEFIYTFVLISLFIATLILMNF